MCYQLTILYRVAVYILRIRISIVYTSNLVIFPNLKTGFLNVIYEINQNLYMYNIFYDNNRIIRTIYIVQYILHIR